MAFDTQETEQREAQYVLEIVLASGDTIRAATGGDRETARSKLGLLHSRLASEPFVQFGDDTIVRSQEVRSIQLKEDDSGPGFFDSLMSRVGGGRDMSTYETREMQQRPGPGPGMDDWIGYGRRRFAETKPFFLTSEFLTFVGSLTAVAIALGTNDLVNGFRGWLLITILASAYMISRGIAKAGTRDPNPTRGGSGSR